jgi:hypothetical protein
MKRSGKEKRKQYKERKPDEERNKNLRFLYDVILWVPMLFLRKVGKN